MITISKINNKTSFGAYKLGESGAKAVKKLSTMQSPAQRGIIGATAFLFQPLIDSQNKKIDQKTRETSIARSLTKGVICTLTGIAIRAGFVKMAENMSKEGGAFYIDKLQNATKAQKGNYINAVGTCIALAGMLITNFLVDAPLTNVGQNFITKNIFHHKDEQPPKGEVKNES